MVTADDEHNHGGDAGQAKDDGDNLGEDAFKGGEGGGILSVNREWKSRRVEE